ncbi:hypothetical protein FS749_005254 [Ceratobasidium sp. UAMH 11750]|nr:hypothetical protein FS749_005254 [Ceratobasidium sp. UAMH 11750]
MPLRLFSPETEDEGLDAQKGPKNQAKKIKYTHGGSDGKGSKRSSRNKSANSGGAVRSNQEHAGDVLASVGETGAGNEAGKQGDDEDDTEFEYESSVGSRPGRDSDVEMRGENDAGGDAAYGEANDPENNDNPGGVAEEEDIVASLYEEEGVGDDTLYRKLLSMIQDLAKDHKLLHEKIAELTIRLDQKEADTRKAGNSRKAAHPRKATDVDVEMHPPSTAKRQTVPKQKPVHWQQHEAYERPAGRRARNPVHLLLGYIRQAILALLGRQTRKELLPDGPPDNIATPSEAMFYVKWTESEKSQFNKVAANIVATKVIKDWPALCLEDDRDCRARSRLESSLCTIGHPSLEGMFSHCEIPTSSQILLPFSISTRASIKVSSRSPISEASKLAQ